MPDDRQYDGMTVNEMKEAWKEADETAQRMQRVSQGHVASLEAHLDAIKEAVSIKPNISYVSMVEHVRGILDGSINIFSGEEQQPIEIVAAVRRLVGRNGNKYWVCRRTSDGRSGGLTGMWEYPGGKVEEGENHIEAIRREMREEFGVEITLTQQEPLDCITRPAPWYNDKLYRLTFFSVTFLSEPKFQVHDLSSWCSPKEMLTYNFLPSGAEFNRRLALAEEEEQT